MDKIKAMQTFVRIVEAGSLSAAAAQLGTTQPTISRRLQTLERSLGLRLLQRSTHAMRLTVDGERCYERAKELLTNWAAFESDLRGASEEPDGILRVVVPHAFGQDRLIKPLADYLRRYPHIVLVPSLILVTTVLSLNVIGERLRSKFDVRDAAV